MAAEADDDDLGFALEVTRFTPAPVTEAFPVASLAELDAIVRRHDGEREVVFGLDCDGGAGGAFWLFLAGERGWIHLTAGGCSTARGRDATAATGLVAFRIDTGEQREIAAGRTVSRTQGVQALRHWFCTEQQWSELEWIADAESGTLDS